jgi:hypothetical protein
VQQLGPLGMTAEMDELGRLMGETVTFYLKPAQAAFIQTFYGINNMFLECQFLLG